MPIAAPNYNPNAQPPVPVRTGTNLNNYSNSGAAFQGVTNPNYPGMTSVNNAPPAYKDIGGGLTFGIATPDQFVSTQLAKDIASNSPYMQLARQSGLDHANARGMLNSSIAAGNSQGAAIQAAMPMALADANMLSDLQKTNLGVKANEDIANIGAAAQTGAAGIAANASMSNNAASLAQAMQAQRENLAYQGEQAGLTRDWTSQFAGQQQGYDMDKLNQQYFNESGLMGQQFQGQLYNGLQMGAQNIAGNLLQGSQNYYSAAGLKAMDNPAIMGNPQAFGGYNNWIQSSFNSMIDNLFSSIYGQGG